MNLVYFIAGVLLMVLAIFLGFYVAIYVLLYKTVTIFIDDPGFWAFVWALVKWSMAAIGGWLTFFFVAIPAGKLIRMGVK